MSEPRDHHYVPIWYQNGFFEPGRSGLSYLDQHPEIVRLPNGKTYTPNSHWSNSPPSRCFVQKDLYTTFFAALPNVEIEKMLFGKLDMRGSAAVRAMAMDDPMEWHKHFQALFEYLDAQKLRTPKGLAWLQRRYRYVTQNMLMEEMQGVRTMHCAIWAGGVREIVSAEDAKTKFIVSDHPVTVYNYAVDAGFSTTRRLLLKPLKRSTR